MPSGRFGANSAWVLCAAIAHNVLRAAGTLAGRTRAVARGATLPADRGTSRPVWAARNAGPSCTYPAIGPGPTRGLHCGTT
jgi:hypothetical protein